MFPRVCAEKRVFHPDFWWNMVQRPTNVGSKKGKDKEKADETKPVEMLFEVLNGKETDNKDGNEYEFGCGDEDDDVVSVVST